MKLSYPCPKCGHSAWLRALDKAVVLSCVCGLSKLVESVRDGAVIFRTERATVNSLPRHGTKLSRCLGLLYHHQPQTTAAMADLLEQTTSDTASQLTVLRAKGLVERTEVNKGLTGGSTWIVSHRGMMILNGENP